MENGNGAGITVKDLANHYLWYQLARRNVGELSVVHLQDCRTILERFTGAVVKQTLMTEIAAQVLHGFRAGLMKRYVPSTVNRHVAVIKALFNYGLDSELIDHVPNLRKALPRVREPCVAAARGATAANRSSTCRRGIESSRPMRKNRRRRRAEYRRAEASPRC